MDKCGYTLFRLCVYIEVSIRDYNSYNCQEPGHVADACKQSCKICQGQHGSHVFWSCPDYKAKDKSKDSYLIMSVNKESINEAYSIDKRPLNASGSDDVNERVTRSGKRVKVRGNFSKSARRIKPPVVEEDIVMTQAEPTVVVFTGLDINYSIE
ncbi:unnamed protein product [Mucor hiemalis]